MEILSRETAAAAIATAAVRVVAALTAADAKRWDGPRLAIPGGSAVKAMAGVWTALPDELRRRVRLTWVDERCVPEADKESNHGAARRGGLVPRDLAAVQPLWWDGATQEEVTARMDLAFAGSLAGGLDVALLGLGEDGHVASLFPGREWRSESWVTFIKDAPKPPPERVSLTLGALMLAGQMILLATGEGKREALTRLVRGDKALPAAHLERLIVVTDLDLERKS